MESFVNYSTPLSVDLKSFDTPLLETEFRVICHAFVPSENLKGSVLPWRLTLQRVPGATIRCAVRHLIFFPLCLDSEVFSQIWMITKGQETRFKVNQFRRVSRLSQSGNPDAYPVLPVARLRITGDSTQLKDFNDTGGSEAWKYSYCIFLRGNILILPLDRPVVFRRATFEDCIYDSRPPFNNDIFKVAQLSSEISRVHLTTLRL